MGGGEPLQRPDGLAVIAELGVVVVLQDGGVAGLRPGRDRPPAVRREDDAGRRLVSRGEHHRLGAGPLQRGHVDAVLVHGDGDAAQPPPAGAQCRVDVAGILEGDDPGAVAGERAQHQVGALREAGADDDPLGVGGRPAYAAQVARQHLPQLAVAAGVAVAQRPGRGRRGSPRASPTSSRRAESSSGPAGPGESRSPAHGRPPPDGGGRWGRLGPGRHSGARAGARGEKALGVQLRVALLDEPA